MVANKNQIIFVGIFSLAFLMMIIPSFAIAYADSDPNANPYYVRTHVTSRFDKTTVCGGHYCTTGEYEKWYAATYQTQRNSYGKVGAGQSGENVMNQLAGSPQSSTSMHGGGNVGYPSK